MPFQVSFIGRCRGFPFSTVLYNVAQDTNVFSVGATIRHMVTGISPAEDAEEFIASKNRLTKKLVRTISRRISKKHLGRRIKKYCTGKDLPEQVNDLVQSLTHYDSFKRATVRSITNHPWIGLSTNSGKEKEHGLLAPPIKLYLGLECLTLKPFYYHEKR